MEDEKTVCRKRANKLYSARRFGEALAQYKEALEMPPQEGNDVILANIAALFDQLEMFDEMLETANQALAITPSHPKASFRRAKALIGLGRLQDARAAVAAIPSDVPTEPLRKLIDDQMDLRKVEARQLFVAISQIRAIFVGRDAPTHAINCHSVLTQTVEQYQAGGIGAAELWRELIETAVEAEMWTFFSEKLLLRGRKHHDLLFNAMEYSRAKRSLNLAPRGKGIPQYPRTGHLKVLLERGPELSHPGVARFIVTNLFNLGLQDDEETREFFEIGVDEALFDAVPPSSDQSDQAKQVRRLTTHGLSNMFGSLTEQEQDFARTNTTFREYCDLVEGDSTALDLSKLPPSRLLLDLSLKIELFDFHHSTLKFASLATPRAITALRFRALELLANSRLDEMRVLIYEITMLRQAQIHGVDRFWFETMMTESGLVELGNLMLKRFEIMSMVLQAVLDFQNEPEEEEEKEEGGEEGESGWAGKGDVVTGESVDIGDIGDLE